MSAPFADPPTKSNLPPLRIHHFMLWTAVTAVMMTVENTDAPVPGFSNQREAAGIPGTLIGSLCLTGLILGFYWRRRGCPFFDEPGQMAFIIQSLWTIYGLIDTAAQGYLSDGAEADGISQLLQALLSFGALGVAIVTLTLYFKYSNKFKHYGQWGKFFKAVGILTILQFLLTFVLGFVVFFTVRVDVNPQYFIYVFALVPLAFGIVEVVYWVMAVREDLREQTDYHWTHWVGASTWPLLRLASLFSIIMMFFYPPDWTAY